MRTDHRIFFAIPFDSATRCLYDQVCKRIRERYPTITTEIGSEEVGPSPEYSDIASFKAQNRELTSQFVKKLRSADIIVADLTHNNPNVHVELGMALTYNKNILRVTGRAVSELGFDIRNLEVRVYRNEEDLTKTILDYCATFFRIKELPISSEHGPLYRCLPNRVPLDASQNRPNILRIGDPGDFAIRDGAARATFELVHTDTDSDWFGIYFRAGTDPFLGGYLLYVRRDGRMELAVYPGPRVLDVRDTARSISGKHELQIEFENNHFHARLDETELRTTNLSQQTPGTIHLVAWNAKVAVESAEVVCRDTIEWE